MRILLVLAFLIFGGTYIFSEFFADKIAKNILEKELSLVAERKVKIQDLKINFLNESAVLNDITVANNNNFPGNLIKLDQINIDINLKSLLDETVEIKSVNVKGLNFEYIVLTKNGKIIDNLSLINQAIKKNNITANLNNITVANNNNFPGNLIKLDQINIDINLKSLLDETVEIKSVNVKGLNFEYIVLTKNGKIIDNLSLINQAIKKNNITANLNNKNKEPKKEYPKKKDDKNFIIKKLNISNSNVKVISQDLDINTQTKLSDMEFLNVGNSKDANHFKDVFAMILTNVISKVQNDVLTQKIKQKFEKKLKDIINEKILGSQNPGSDKNILEGILKENKDDLLKKFDKLFK